MAINPEQLNLIDIKGLSVAFNPTLGWVLAIQDPETDVITQISLQTIGQLIAGDIQLPDGVINGLNVTFNNGTDPKTGSVSAGQWRINNGVYQINVPFVSNINAPSVSDRTDAFLADDTGDIFYQPNFDGTLADGQILVRQFTVFANGSDIDSGASNPVQYAVMNGQNNGSFTVVSPGDWVDQVYTALANSNVAARYGIRNNSSGVSATAGYQAENDIGRKINFLITSSGHTAFGLGPDKAYLLTGGAPLDIISPNLTWNGLPIGGGGSALTFTEDSDSNTDVDLSGKTGMPVSGTLPSSLRVYYADVDYSQSATYNPTTQKVNTGLESTTGITIKITF